ncbi:MAG: hypothetical protein ACI4O0_09045 [Candidatus Limivicinus sp.]
MKTKKMKCLLTTAVMLCLMVSLFSFGAYADANVSCTVNQNIGSVAVNRGVSNILSCSYTGSIPEGLQLSYVNADIYLSGTPTRAGNYTAQINMETESGPSSFTLNVTVSEAASPTFAPIEEEKPAANTPPVITKNPTGETVEEGGSAQFVARADNADSFVWRLVSADTTNTIPAKDAAYYFRGLEVSGADTERLSLSNIPKSLNGWAVECKFTNAAGSSFTTGAIIRVSGATSTTNDPKDTTSNNNNAAASTNELQAPKINTQPKGAELSAGQSHTMTVYASNASGIGTITYQWYSSDSNNMNNIKAIDGANSTSYTAPETAGTKYYCVGVWLSKDGQKSTTTYSPLVAVTYNNTAGSTTGSTTENTTGNAGLSTGLPLPGSTASPAPTVTANPTAAPMPTSGGDSYNRDTSSTLVFYIVVAVLALVAVGGILVYLALINRRRGGDE